MITEQHCVPMPLNCSLKWLHGFCSKGFFEKKHSLIISFISGKIQVFSYAQNFENFMKF